MASGSELIPSSRALTEARAVQSCGGMGTEISRRTVRSTPSAAVRRVTPPLLAVGLMTLAGCDRAPSRGPNDVMTTSGQLPAPGSVPPPSRTVDSAGFVDNAGRTASEDVRTTMSGMRATEVGSQRLTGTPGSGLPLPIEPPTRRPPPGEAPGEPAPGTETGPSTPIDAVTQGVATMICTHAASCGQIGAGKRWASGATCIADRTPELHRELAGAACPYDFDVNAVSACVSALRSRPCTHGVDALASVPECEPRSLCVSR